MGEPRFPLVAGNCVVPLFCCFFFSFFHPSPSPAFPLLSLFSQTKTPEILTEDHFPCGWISSFCSLPLGFTFLPGSACSWFLPPSLCPWAGLLPLPTCPQPLICCCCCSVAKSCPTLSDPLDCSMPGSPVLHHLQEFAPFFSSSILDTFQPGGGLIFQRLIFLPFHIFHGFLQREYWSGLPLSPPEEHILSELFTLTRLPWVTLHGMAHNFTESRKPLLHNKAVIHAGVNSCSCLHK